MESRALIQLEFTKILAHLSSLAVSEPGAEAGPGSPTASSARLTLTLEWEVTAPEENPSICLNDFNLILEKVQQNSTEFWARVAREIEG